MVGDINIYKCVCNVVSYISVWECKAIFICLIHYMVCYVRVVEVCQGSYIENSDGKSLWDPVAILSIVAVHLNLTE